MDYSSTFLGIKKFRSKSKKKNKFKAFKCNIQKQSKKMLDLRKKNFFIEQQECAYKKKRRLNRIKTVDSSLHTHMTLSANINCSNAIQSSWHFPK